MKGYPRFLLAAFVLLCINESLAVPAGNDCIDGDTKTHVDGCNHCFCSKGLWACTLMLCTNEPFPDKVLEKREAPECMDGELKTEDCNQCHCVQGVWGCSRKACPKAKRGAECSEGDTKMVECNTCSCTKGLWVCTRKYCPKKKREVPPKVLADLKNVPCSPSDSFFFDCNRCQCNFERTGYACVKAQNCTLTT